MLIVASHGGEGGANLRIQFGRERRVHHPLADLRTGLGQGIDVVDIEGIQRRMDLIIQAALLEKVAVGLGGSGETTRDRYTGAGKVADHLAQGGVLAPYVLNIVIAELIEGNYVLYQGDLSTKVLEKLKGLGNSAAHVRTDCGRALENK
jgi:hypothetical protein